MGTYLEHVKHNELFENSPITPIIINDIPTITQDQKEYLNNLIYKRFQSDLLSNEPTCECGSTKGAYNIGVICRNCNTAVKDEMDQELHPLVWIRSPIGVGRLLNPIILMSLIKHFNKGNFSLIEWLINTDYVSSGQRPAYLDTLIASGIKRGYNNFVSNIEQYLNIIFDIKVFKTKKGLHDPLYYLTIKDLRDGALLSDYIPLINRSILVIEETSVGKWVDPIVMGAIDAIRTVSSIDDPIMDFTIRQKENRMAKALIALANYYKDTIDEVLSDKPGLFRKHIFACRNHFSMRNVISSLTKTHQYDELHIPWGAAVTIFKIHLMNKLDARGFTVNDATALLHESVYRFDPLVRELFDELFSESRDGCIYCIWQRNPSLTRASAQRMRITVIKNDPNDPTIGMSILAVRGFNADFDGDQMNLTLCLDNDTADQAEPLAPHKNMMDIHNPRKLSGIAAIPKQVVGTIANWMHCDEEVVVTQEQNTFMQRLVMM